MGKGAGPDHRRSGLICFAAVEAFIIFPMLGKPHKDLDYLVVLGAQVKGETVSNSLRLRLDEALDYLEENPRTRVVVTGGKGRARTSPRRPPCGII